MNDVYQTLRKEVLGVLGETADICQKLSMKESVFLLKERYECLENHRLTVGVLGEMKRGKSTVINSLLGQEILPSDIRPCTAAITRITYGPEPKAEILMKDGSRKQISFEMLEDYLTMLNEESRRRAEEIKEVIISYPSFFCKNGVDIIDTPGLNLDEKMDCITETALPELDVVLMVIVPDSPMSDTEIEYLRNILRIISLKNILFLVNKVDYVRREEDRIFFSEEVKKRILENVIKMKETAWTLKLCQESETLKNKFNKDDIHVCSVSALDALDGMTQNKQALVRNSGYDWFKIVLRKMLSENRTVLGLNGHVSAADLILMEAENKVLMESSHNFQLSDMLGAMTNHNTEIIENELLEKIIRNRVRLMAVKKLIKNTNNGPIERIESISSDSIEDYRRRRLDRDPFACLYGCPRSKVVSYSALQNRFLLEVINYGNDGSKL